MMKKYFILFSIMIFLNACNSKKINDKPIITTSIPPIKYFIDFISGDKWNVISIIPPNANHNNYEPVPEDLKNIQKSIIYFKTGNIGFEDAWVERFKNINKQCKFIDVSKNINKIGIHYHNGIMTYDPHYWLSPKESLIIAKNIYEALVDIDNKNKEIYLENYNKLCDTINDTDRRINNILSKLKCKTFLIYHPALTYFAENYKLNQISIEHEGKEPTVFHIMEIIEAAKKNNIKILLYQSQYTSSSAINISKEINVKPVCFDPMVYNWQESMIGIANIFIENQ